MTKGLQNRGATKSELLFGIITPTALIGKGNILKALLGDYFNFVWLTTVETTAALMESDTSSAPRDHIALLLYDGV